MHEVERLARLDELVRFELWCQTHNPAMYMQYLGERSVDLNKPELRQTGTKGHTKRIHATRASILELLSTLKDIGYDNQDLAKFHIDIIVYRIEAIWKGIKHDKQT